jgi:hypothetical protein
MLSVLLMLVITVLIDFDRLRRGWIRNTQESMIRLQHSLAKDAP